MARNVLLIVTDDQRFNTIHALGNPDVLTPNLDALCRRGTAFTQAHIPGGTSGAICMPSRAMLHSGRTLFHIEGEGQNIPVGHTTLAETMQRAGYECFGTGKWHNGPPAFARGFTCGSSIFFGGMWDHWNVPVCRFDPTGEYDNVINFVADFPHSHKPRRVHCDKFNPGVHSSTLLTDETIRFLRERDRKKPFFAYLSYLAPHDPRTMPPRYRAMYDPDSLTLPENCMAEYPFPYGVEGIRDEVLIPYPRTEKAMREELADYYAMITHLDDELGRVLHELKEQKLLDDTLIVFTSDNGLGMGSHAFMGKQNHYEESIRVPLIFSGPGIPENERRDGYVYLLDIYPTLCSYLGIPVPVSVEGQSFAPLLTENRPGRDHLYFAYNEMIRSVKQDGWMLMEYCGRTRRTELYDLNRDPMELHNQAGCAPQRVAQLRALLQAERTRWEDSGHPYTEMFWNAYETAQKEESV